jgi:type II secretory pathway component GspD/PulD (secretin)
MKLISEAAARARCQWSNSASMLAGALLALTFAATGISASAQSTDDKSSEGKDNSETYQTIYLTNLTQNNDANDIQTALRNMLHKARIYYVPSQGALTVIGRPEDIALAQRIVVDLDKVKKVYRLTYTITDMDGGKRVSAQHYALVVASGGRTTFKLGSKVPIVTGSYDEGKSGMNTQVQYQDVGLSIEASLDGYMDGVRLRSKIEQSSVSDEKSVAGAQDPVVRQNVLDGTSTLVPGKPLQLGSLDVPGTTRKQEIEVVSELIR